jgi:folate-dependent phosphoribosylglycinamide formyltransferase PurN
MTCLVSAGGRGLELQALASKFGDRVLDLQIQMHTSEHYAAAAASAAAARTAEMRWISNLVLPPPAPPLAKRELAISEFEL